MCYTPHMGLTRQQEDFAQLVVAGEPYTVAKSRAYPNCHLTGVALRVEGTRLAARPVVSARIAELREAMAERWRVSSARVLDEYARLAFGAPEPGAVWPKLEALKGIRQMLGYDAPRRTADDSSLTVRVDVQHLIHVYAQLSPAALVEVRAALEAAPEAGGEPVEVGPSPGAASDPGY